MSEWVSLGVSELIVNRQYRLFFKVNATLIMLSICFTRKSLSTNCINYIQTKSVDDPCMGDHFLIF